MTKLNVWKRVCLLFLLCAGTAIASHAQATYTVLYNFGSNEGDPIVPSVPGIIAQGQDGNLYSTAIGPNGVSNAGTVFSITLAGALTVIHDFSSLSGGEYGPYAGLTLGTDGNFYGATFYGGASNFGALYRITPTGTLSNFHTFTSSDSSSPLAPPIQGADGNWYGTTSDGSNAAGCFDGCGTIYKITPAGVFTTLYQFDGISGRYPESPLVQGTDGNFYGTTDTGGTKNGVIFKITSQGKFTVLYNFDGLHGLYPQAPLIQGSDGNLYGAAKGGGTHGQGVIFRIKPTGNKITVLHNMYVPTDGGYPDAGLVQASDGNFYGLNTVGGLYGMGTIFRFSPDGSFLTIYNFDSTTGSTPIALMQHTNGLLYGDTDSGGTGSTDFCSGNCGVFFSLDVGLGPFVSLVRNSGKVGSTMGVLGQGFTGTTDVSLNATAASFTVVSDTYLTAKVPSGATTGFVTVTTPSGTLTSSQVFRIKP